ncbi:DUF2339 domain-containing protein, partial [Kribbia dieselivorans]|uniref:DUF2339 domain-containing protein n=1 Tax=Kribbia dieselivorans TaxID=331526 RepID=UPI000B08CC2A
LVLGLGALSGVVVSAAVLLVRDPLLQPTAFQVGHALSTLAWLGIAAWLLMRGLGPSRSATLALRVGLGIALAAVAKLFLFDMSTLTSLARVLSFIPAGLILLGMGAGYAKALERARRGEPTPG